MQLILNKFFNKGKNKIPKREKDFDHPLLKILKPCDVIVKRFSGEKDFMGSIIAHYTSSPYSHAEIHLYDGIVVSAEATGVLYVDSLKRKNAKIDIFRYLKLTREERLIITAKAHQSVFKPYHYANLLYYPFMTDKQAAKWSKNEAYICSENVAWCYKEAGIDLVPESPEAAEDPSDLANSKVLKYFGTYDVETGKIISMEAKNKLLVDQKYNKHAKKVSAIIKFLSELDKK